MENYTMTEDFMLPSEGKIYATEVAPKVTLRSMTTQDEMIRLSPSDNMFEPMCRLIDSCIVNDIGISSYDMCLGDYLFLLYRLRAVTYGEDYTMSSVCPYCGSKHIEKVKLDELEVIKLDADKLRYKEFELPVTKKRIKLKFQTPRMLDDIQRKTKEFKAKHKDITSDFTLVHTLTEIIEEIDGKHPDIIALEEWIKSLPMKDTNIILQNASMMNQVVGVNTTVECLCDVCGLTFPTKVRSDSEFFRPALD